MESTTNPFTSKGGGTLRFESGDRKSRFDGLALYGCLLRAFKALRHLGERFCCSGNLYVVQQPRTDFSVWESSGRDL